MQAADGYTERWGVGWSEGSVGWTPPTQPLTHTCPCPFLPPTLVTAQLPILPPLWSQAQKAEEQLDAALSYKASFLDGYLGKSSLAQLRAKLAADYLITPVK